ncbi:hypothetical protein [Nocardia sp. NPDC020380]|uniref:hypothetical protein n=1 Tax=Nocardia sp. NPDC020380 TaxID=3364309 RepID=UPI0037B7B869
MPRVPAGNRALTWFLYRYQGIRPPRRSSAERLRDLAVRPLLYARVAQLSLRYLLHNRARLSEGGNHWTARN